MEGTKQIKLISFHQCSINYEVETTWICLISWDHKTSILSRYILLLSFFLYIIPISVILVTHTQIIGIVRQRTQAATSFRHSNRADVTIRKSRKTTQILLIIALMFGAHWLPYHIYTIGECFSSIYIY